MLLGRNFQDSGNSSGVVLQDMSNIVGYMLVDQNNTNVIASSKFGKCFLDLFQVGVLLDDEKVGAFSSPVADTC